METANKTQHVHTFPKLVTHHVESEEHLQTFYLECCYKYVCHTKGKLLFLVTQWIKMKLWGKNQTSPPV